MATVGVVTASKHKLKPSKNRTPRERAVVAKTTETTAGAWAALLDCAKFEQDVYAQRLVKSKPVEPL